MSRRAIIAGAGIGGLATALALSQARFDVALYERSDTLEEFGAGLQLTPNASRVLSNLGVLESVRLAATSPRAICVFRGLDDHALMRMPVDRAVCRWGAPYLVIHRADLQQALAAAVKRRRNIKLCYGSTVADVENRDERVSVEVKRGSTTVTDSADLLIGADGLRSRVREHLGLGEQEKRSE